MRTILSMPQVFGNNALKFKATIKLQSGLGSEQRVQIAGAVTVSGLDSPLTN